MREAVQPIVCVLHEDEALPESPGDSSVNPSKPFDTTRQQPVSYLGLHVNQMQVLLFSTNCQIYMAEHVLPYH